VGPREEDHPFSTRFVIVPQSGIRENPFNRGRIPADRGNARELNERFVHQIRREWGERMPKQFKVLIVSASVEDRKALLHVLESLSTNVISCSNLAQAGEVLSRQTTGLVFCDDRLPDGTYRDLLTLRQTGQRSLCFVVTTRVGEWDEYLEATQLGAFDVIPFPLRATDVELTVIRAMRREEQKAGYMTA